MKVPKIFVFLGILILTLILFGIWGNNLFANNKFLLNQKSYANLSIKDDKLKLTFEIYDNDLSKSKSLLNKLELPEKILDGLSFEINDQSLEVLKPILPAKLNLEIKDGEFEFNNHTLPNLKSSTLGNVQVFATDSGKLESRVQDLKNYNIKIKNPYEVYKYATSSGKLRQSAYMEAIFPTLSKIDRIEIEVSNGKIKGKVKIK